MPTSCLSLIYPLLGLFFGLLFVFCLANIIDPHARQGSLGFRLTILPASIILWPLVLIVFLRRISSHTEPADSPLPEPKRRGRPRKKSSSKTK